MLLLLIATAIFAFGLVMIFSTTSADIMDHELNKNTHQALIKQIYYACAGLVMAAGIVKLGYRNLLKYSAPLLLLFTILLLLTLIPGIGKEVNGSKRWLHIAGFSFQPSEFVKYLVPAFFIHHYLLHQPDTFTIRHFIKLLGILSIPMLLILVEPNNGTTFVIATTLLVLFFIARIPLKFWAWPLLAAILVGGVFASQLPYVAGRMKVYLNPELDLKGKGHQPYQAKIAAGSGGLLGKGPGNGLQKLSYLPEAQNDYIAAIYGEEFGFLGVVGLITLYLLLAGTGFYIAYQSKSCAGFYFAGCVAFLISYQAFLNLSVVSGLLPSTGLNLPLFSQGGSSLMANIIGLAILTSVAEEVKRD